ncbi:glycoside hydrolase family 2 protein [Algibacter lectus]|uniref:Beta-galactosidase/beta-glucuronidase n=1 Tax=Algibacter lectus TaxID=221126 RepID=A0A4R8M395_9FLAO|nr:glycoside hydrolase family 2 TIM barrel-domain containing protein [Algibacter lectus]TDY59653.1 beta-galactosidase/beta-glucuronidase [Algibacter lectus]
MDFKVPILIRILCFIVTSFSYAQSNENISLNGKWSFKTDPYAQGESSQWFAKDVNTGSWGTMAVPGNWDLVNEYSEYVGDAWYTRTFTVKEIQSTEQLRLVFQSVYNNSKVWVNGHLVGEHDFGFLPFHFNISEYINPEKENRLTVLVNNVFKSGAMWNWGGIRRPVWLELTSKTRIEFQHIDAVPNLKKGTAQLDVKIVSSNASNTPRNVLFNIDIKSNGKIVAKGEVKTIVPANSNKHIVKWAYHLPKSKVNLWHFDFPNLYESTVTLSENKEILHTNSDRFGIRKLEIKGLKLLLNGESIRPVGFNVVPEDRFTGNTLPIERIKEDVDLMKSLGANMARLSHVNLPKEYIDYLDEKGIMIFEEVGLWGKDILVDPEHPKPKEWLQRIIENNYNHPAVIGWSVGNELGMASKNPKVDAYIKGAIEMAEKLDPNRIAVSVSNSANNSPKEATMYADLAMLNGYQNWGKKADGTWKNHKKPIFMSEFGYELNSEDPSLGDVPAEKILNQLRNKEYVLGASLWTFNDYRSTYHGKDGWKTPPSQNRAWGIVTSFRDKKKGFYSVQKEFSPIKNLTVSNINTAERHAKVTIQPREKLDIPANILRGYKVQYTLFDSDFKPVETKTENIKTIFPGDDTFDVFLEWSAKDNLSMIEVSFLDPQGYKVYTDVVKFQVPKQPVITFANTANNGIRVFFEKSKDAEAYYVRYEKDGLIFNTKKTTNNFIDIEDKKIKQGDVWQYQLIAVNNKGESVPSEVKELIKDEDELPPIIWNTKHTENGVFIAYSVSPYDYLYEVLYGTNPNKYNQKLTTKVKGVLNIPNIKKGIPIYYKMRVIKQWGFASEWTQELKSE